MLTNNVVAKLSNSRKLVLEGGYQVAVLDKRLSQQRKEIISVSEMMIYYLRDSRPHRASSPRQLAKQINSVC